MSTLLKAGFQGVWIENGAGAGAKFTVSQAAEGRFPPPNLCRQFSLVLQDEDYKTSGAKIVNAKEAFGQDIVLKVRPPKIDPEAGQFKDGARYIALYQRTFRPVALQRFAMQAFALAVVHATCPAAYPSSSCASNPILCTQAGQLHLPWTQQRTAG